MPSARPPYQDSIICRKALRWGQNGMGVAPGMGTDFVFLLAPADVGVMGDKQTVELLYNDDINKSPTRIRPGRT